MRNDEFDLLLAMLDRLEVEQKQRLQAALAAGAVAEDLLGVLPQLHAEGRVPQDVEAEVDDDLGVTGVVEVAGRHPLA